MTRPRVVIVGAGPAGLAAARALRDRPWRRSHVDVTVIDQHTYYAPAPARDRVAAGRMHAEAAARPVRALLAGVPNATFRPARVQAIQPRLRRVDTDRGPMDYDYLIVAAGSTAAPPTPAGPDALAVGDLRAALEVHDRWVTCFETAAWADGPATRARLLTIVVVGAGPAGVHLAAELAAATVRSPVPGITPGEATVVVVGSARAPTSSLPGPAGGGIAALRDLGVRWEPGVSVDAIDGRGVTLSDGRRIDAGTVVVAGGKDADPLAETFAVTGTNGRVVVGPTLQIDHYPEILLAGSMADVPGRAGTQPPTPAVSAQMGRHAATTLLRLVGGRQPRPFAPRDGGLMVNVRDGDTVGHAGRLGVRGIAGQTVWAALHLAPGTGVRAKAGFAARWATSSLRRRPSALAVGPSHTPTVADPAPRPQRADLPSVNVGNANDFGRVAALSWWTQDLPGEGSPPAEPGPIATLRSRMVKLRHELTGTKSQTQDNYRT